MKARRFVIFKELGPRFGIHYCRVHLRRLERAKPEPKFPQRVDIGPGRKGWYEDEIIEWVNNRLRSENDPDED